MSDTLLEPVELRAKGFEILARTVGWVNAVRFIQQYEPSRLNYTAERDSLLPDWDADEMVRRMNQLKDERREMQSGGST
jgi:hypothetical protein